jgi:TPR repeat protein
MAAAPRSRAKGLVVRKGRLTKAPYEQALALATRKRPDFERAAELLLRADQARDARATYALGTWYLYGRHFRKDVRRGMRLVKRAAEAGIPDALFDLAVSYELGRTVPKNERKAALLYLKAALGGYYQAAYEVGRCYYYGIGCAADRPIGCTWIEYAAAHGVKPRVDADRGTERAAVSKRVSGKRK